MDASSSKMLKTENEEPSLLILNDYCLHNIFSRLKLRDLYVVSELCQRFSTIAERSFQKHQVLDIPELYYDGIKTVEEVMSITRKVEKNVHTLKIGRVEIDKDTKIPSLKIERDYGFYDFLAIPFSFHPGVFTFPSLKVVDLTRGNFKDEIISSFLPLEQLEVLHLGLNHIIFGNCFDRLENIRELNLEHSTVFKFPFSRDLSNLRSLNVAYCFILDDSCIESIGRHCHELTKLVISDGRDITNFSYLSNIPTMKHLIIKKPHFPYDNNMNELLLEFSRKNCLETLQIYRYIIFEIGGVRKLNISNLKTFMVEFPFKETGDSVLASISENHKLEKLYIRNSKFTPICLEGLIKRCPSITFIDVSNCIQLENDFILSIFEFLHERSTHTLTMHVYGTSITQNVCESFLRENNYLKLDFENHPPPIL